MKIRILEYCAGIAVAMLMSMTMAQAGNLKDVEITDEFPLERCIGGLKTRCLGDDCNQYLPLIVRRVWDLDNEACDDCDEDESVRISVLNETEMINYGAYSVRTRVYEEREWVDEELTEVSRNFLNQCENTQDIYYWGEEVCVPAGSDAAEEPPFPYTTPCEDGLVPGGGAWKAGIDDAAPGILFPGGAFLIGARYFQELAANALDWAENAELGLEVENPANGMFEDCVLVLDRNAIEDPMGKEADEKVYCPDIGIVRDEELELTSCSDGMGICAQQ